MAAVRAVVVVSRFSVGCVVALWRVRDEGVVRHEGGVLVATGRVPEDGVLRFEDSALEVGARYLAVGYDEGRPVEHRCAGVTVDEAGGLAQPGVVADPRKFAGGVPVPVVRDAEAPVVRRPARKRRSSAGGKPAAKPAGTPARKKPGAKSAPVKKRAAAKSSANTTTKGK